ncbi:MAG TPA: hypothetical protein ENN69_08995 [Spirochaetia bacterium]|nr:hypothetical protein [Spirochaetia bacterium]
MDGAGSLYHFLKTGKRSRPLEPRSGSGRERNAAKATLQGFEQIGEFTFRRRRRVPSPLSVPAHETLLFTGTTPGDLLFFDTESTGLSGGAGNTIFLLGIGRPEGEELVIEQYFLADFPGEKEFLSACLSLFSPNRLLVSYNGRTFDAPVLAARFALHRLSCPLPRHCDLLPPTRRLWKHTVGSCSLKNIERAVLGVKRENDVDGAEVPERYFRYLRSRDPRHLDEVVTHNEIDVLSLSRLLGVLERLRREPEHAQAPATAPADVSALAALVAPHDAERAFKLLEVGLASGDIRAGLSLGFRYKQCGRQAEAQRVFERLFEIRGDLTAGIEIAKYAEHRARDPERALSVVTALLDRRPRPEPPVRELLLYRKARLERKCIRF